MQAKRYGEIADTIRELCARSIGCSLREASDAIERTFNITSVYLINLVKTGSAFKAGVHGEYRYFSNPDDAAAHDVIAKQERLERLKESEKRKKEYQYNYDKEKRAKNRAAKGLPTYEEELKMRQAKKQPKKQTIDLTPRKSGVVLSTTEGERQNKKSHIAAKIVWPDHVKVQIVPGYRGDTRFKFTPEPGWRGAITEDWMARQLG